MNEDRPNPDLLLRQIRGQEEEKKHGRLKVFFGYAAGVGKTYAMLEAAHAAKEKGIDVVAGYIEPHTRPETIALLEGLEQLPSLLLEHKGISLKEFDLDGAIRRHPQLILVDELAHSNAQGCRHLKRYQDIEELLNAGIDVYTTINVQHIESLNDIVASITGIVVRERIPDRVFDWADQVELVDIEPDDLIDRINKGKVYKAAQAQKALGNFFAKENLVALREIALRRTADRVNQAAEKGKNVSKKNDYYTGEHILICLSGSPSNAKVIRTAARMANAFHGTFTALFVETPGFMGLSTENRARLRSNLKLAEQLGARIATVYGEDVPYQISEYAKVSGVSKIVIGRSNNKKHWFLPKTNFVERLTALAPNIDIYIIPDTLPPFSRKWSKRPPAVTFSWKDALKTALILTLSTLIGLCFYQWGFSEANTITVYILAVLVTAIFTNGRIYSASASVLGVLVFNFFFTDPRFSLQAYDSGYPLTFLIMFLASLLASSLAMKVKKQAHQTALKSYRTEILLETSQKLQRAENRDEIMQAAAHQLLKLLDKTIILYPAGENGLEKPLVFQKEGDYSDTAAFTAPDEYAVAQWVFKNNKHAGATTNTLPGAKCLCLAVRSHETVFTVVAIPMEPGSSFEAFERNLLIGTLSECALALEKDRINETKNQIAMQAQQEQLRANLLRAISHDLRTPLTSISGNAGILMGNSSVLDQTKKMQLYTDIYDDSMWLINLVENLLSVTRIDNGNMNIHMEPELMDEVIREALCHINRKKSEHHIEVDLKDDMLMARMDSRLIIQVIINIVDNAIKYTQAGSLINISARKEREMVLVEIEDDGDGIPDDRKGRLFDMFFTLDHNRADGRRGLGLGLSLCKSIITSHGGTIWVRDNHPRGTVFCFTLQAEEVNVL